MISIDAFLFDLDGTLIDSKKDIALAVQHVQKELGYPESSETDVGTFIGDGVGQLMQRALPQVDPTTLEHAVTMLKAHYREHCLDNTRAYPHVEKTLRFFRHKKMAVVTNKPVRISNRILEGLGLAPFFQLVLGGDSLPRKKPHPDPIHEALRHLRLNDPRRVVIVGDSANDIWAGREAGILTCGLYSNIGDRQALEACKPDFSVINTHELTCIFS